jgi:hypothetical protein
MPIRATTCSRRASRRADDGGACSAGGRDRPPLDDGLAEDARAVLAHRRVGGVAGRHEAVAVVDPVGVEGETWRSRFPRPDRLLQRYTSPYADAPIPAACTRCVMGRCGRRTAGRAVVQDRRVGHVAGVGNETLELRLASSRPGLPRSRTARTPAPSRSGCLAGLGSRRGQATGQFDPKQVLRTPRSPRAIRRRSPHLVCRGRAQIARPQERPQPVSGGASG